MYWLHPFHKVLVDYSWTEERPDSNPLNDWIEPKCSSAELRWRLPRDPIHMKRFLILVWNFQNKALAVFHLYDCYISHNREFSLSIWTLPHLFSVCIRLESVRQSIPLDFLSSSDIILHHGWQQLQKSARQCQSLQLLSLPTIKQVNTPFECYYSNACCVLCYTWLCCSQMELSDNINFQLSS